MMRRFIWNFLMSIRYVYIQFIFKTCSEILYHVSLSNWYDFVFVCSSWITKYIWTASSEFGTYRLCEQRRFRRACASAQSRQNLRCSLIQAVNLEEPWDRKPDPWPSWMAGHAQLKFVMTECSKTQIRLTALIYKTRWIGVHRVFTMFRMECERSGNGMLV